MDTSREILLQVLSNVLEQFAFMFVEAPEQDTAPGDPHETYLHVAITFQGKQEGSICLTAPESLCREMAANVLGTDPGEAGPGEGEDAIKELVNIVCGELTPSLFGEREVFDLTVPHLYRIDWSKWQELAADSEAVRLWVDDKPILASLTMANR